MDHLKKLFKGEKKETGSEAGDGAADEGKRDNGDGDGDGHGASTTASTIKEAPVEYGFGDPVFEDEDPNVDIIAIHGLHGDRIKTWTDQTTGVFWLSELLPQTLKEANIRARILTYGYNANTHARDAVSVQDLWGHGEAFLGQLIGKRRKDETADRPIVFIVHSLGGLVLKSALIMSNASTPTHFKHNKALKLSTHGIIFCGVPHQGGNGASLGKVMLNIGSVATYTTTKIVRVLEPDDEVLRTQRDSYTFISDDFYTVPLFETQRTPIGMGMTKLIVPRDSAVLPGQTGRKYSAPIGMDGKNHNTMVKFSSLRDSAYDVLSTQLVLMLKEAYKDVNDNWDKWARDLRAELHTEARLRPMIPYSLTPRFCGRKEELMALGHALSLSGNYRQRKIIGVHGAGGTGKTELVLKFLHDHEEDFTSVLWVSAANQKAAEAGYIDAMRQLVSIEVKNAPNNKPDFAKIARDLDIIGLVDQDGLVDPPDDDVEAINRIVEAVGKWLSRSLNKNWLLIFDNYDAMDFDLQKIYFPKCSWGSILITSRRPEIKSFATIPLVFPDALDGLDEDSAIALLLSISGRDGNDIEVWTQAQAIVKTLYCLPLAIDQAAAYIALRPQMTMQTYLVRYYTMAKELLGNNEHQYPTYELTCMTTWEISHNAIRGKSREAAILLQVCSFFNNDDIWGGFLRRSFYVEGQIQSGSQIDDYLAQIYSYHLIRPKLAADTFSMHAVVTTWARERLDPTDRMFCTLGAARMMSDALHHVDKHNAVRTTEEFAFEKKLLPHMESFMRVNSSLLGPASLRKAMEQVAYSNNGFREQVISRVDTALSNLGLDLLDYDKTKDIHPSVLIGPRFYRSENTINPKNYGQITDTQTIAMNGLLPIADAFSRLGRYQASMRVNLAMMYYFLSFSDATDVTPVIARFANIAHGLREMSKYAAAEKLYRFAIEKWPQSHPQRAERVRQIKVELASTMSRLGRYEEADKLHSELSSVEQGPQDEFDEQNLLEMSNRAVHLSRVGKHVEAETMHRAVLSSREKYIGTEHPDTLLTLNSLALSLEKQNKLPEAEAMHRKALSGRQAIRPEGHQEITRSMNNLAVTLEKQRKSTEAIELYTEALETQVKWQGELDSETLRTRKNLGVLFARLKNFAAGEPEVRKSVLGLAETLGLEHPVTLHAIVDWAGILKDMHRLNGSRNLYVYVLQVRTRVYILDNALQNAITGIQSLVDQFVRENQMDKAKSLEATGNDIMGRLRIRQMEALAM